MDGVPVPGPGLIAQAYIHLTLMADQASDIPVADRLLVVFEDSRSPFGCHFNFGLHPLGEMTLGTGELASVASWGDLMARGPSLKIIGHEDPVIHPQQGPGVRGFLPLGVNVPMAFPAPARSPQ